MPVYGIAIGFLFIYYAIILLTIRFLKNYKWGKYVVCLLFILPILWAIVDFVGLINFLMGGLLQDMK